jgi:hypothetical protein
MRKLVAVGLLLSSIATARAARAQEEPLKIELYGGYDDVRFNINASVEGQRPSQTFNGNGGEGQLVYNVNKWLGALGDFSGLWATNSTTAGGAAIPYLFGPRLSLRHRMVTPFAQVLEEAL